MKYSLATALIASAILAGCSKDDTGPAVQPMNSFLVVTLQNTASNDFRLVRYDLNGTGGELYINQRFPDNSLYGYPDLTATGDKLVYTGHDSIYTMNVNSKTSTFIYKNIDNRIQFPIISRDGLKIAFSAYPNGGSQVDVFVMNATSGSAPFNVTRNEDDYLSFGPSFNADATKLTYTIGYNADDAVYVSDIQGNNKVRISEAHSFGDSDAQPVFSKDGNKVVYTSSKFNGGNGTYDIAVSNIAEGAEGTATRLTNAVNNNILYSYYPVISKDGATVYFIGFKADGSFGIFKVAYEGGATVLVGNVTLGTDDSIVGLHFVEQ
jgi:Tol biopolymer transport system component